MIPVSSFENALTLISPRIIHTPVIHSPSLSRLFGAQIFLKLENLQVTGSFKVRGAMVKLFSGNTPLSPKGVVTASAGNHAQGVALSAKLAGIPSTIVMPEWASITKQEATRNYGGEVIITGKSIGETLDKAHELEKSGKTFIHPFDDPDIVTGQGTIGLEILKDISDVDMVIIPVGGGGLIGGVSACIKQTHPGVRIIGVQTEACPAAAAALKEKKIIEVPSTSSIADGITVRKIGELNFKLMRSFVDGIVLVDEELIASAMLMLLERKKILAEGAGAVPLAALIGQKIKIEKGQKILLLISGGNVDSPLLGRIINRGLNRSGRVIRMTVVLSDVPGSMASLLTTIARMKANVLHIHHERNALDIPINTSRVTLELETRGMDHSTEIIGELKKEGTMVHMG